MSHIIENPHVERDMTIRFACELYRNQRNDKDAKENGMNPLMIWKNLNYRAYDEHVVPIILNRLIANNQREGLLIYNSVSHKVSLTTRGTVWAEKNCVGKLQHQYREGIIVLSNVGYAIPKEGEEYVANREKYAEDKIRTLCDLNNIHRNARMVSGCNLIEEDLKFIVLVDEAYKSFLIGLYHSTVSLCSMAIERLCYDIIENSKINIRNKELTYEQKKLLFNIPFIKIVEFLRSLELIDERARLNMIKINNLRNRYVHPYLEKDSFQDAKSSINLLCRVIDSFTEMRKS